MAFVKQTLTIIFISAYIISTIHVDARFAPWPTVGAPAPAAADNEESDIEPNPSDLLLLPDITEIIPDETGGTDADVANRVTKQMQVIGKKIDEFNASLKARMENPNASHGIEECLTECDEVFGAAVDDIRNTIDSLENLNLMKANFDVSAVATNVDTCNDCFKEMVGGDPEVEKFNDWVRSITGEALEALQKTTN